jgi:hypothetical protein
MFYIADGVAGMHQPSVAGADVTISLSIILPANMAPGVGTQYRTAVVLLPLQANSHARILSAS